MCINKNSKALIMLVVSCFYENWEAYQHQDETTNIQQYLISTLIMMGKLLKIKKKKTKT